MQQREKKYRVNLHLLEDEEVKEFRKTLADELGEGLMGDVNMGWCKFKGTLKTVQSCLPLILEREESDWMTNEVRKCHERNRRHGQSGQNLREMTP